MGQHIGYIRVSSAEQSTIRQLEGLSLDKTFTDRTSGKDKNRPQLKACLDYIREGDTLHVHSLDRLGRSLRDLEEIVSELVGQGVTIVFHKENMTFNQESNGSMGKLLFQILGAFAEFERNMIKERQMEGIEQARKQGKHLGRYPKLNPEQKADLYARFRKGSSKRSLSKIFGVSRATVYNIINELEIKT